MASVSPSIAAPASESASVSIGIIGASGYGGAELLRRLAAHPHCRVSAVGSRQYLDQSLDACWPQLAGHYPDLRFSDSDAVIANCEVLLCAAPHGAAMDSVASAIAQGKRVVDLSADFRIAPDDYAYWYKQEHRHPELYAQAVYGLVELHREEIIGADLVANPGCYPSTSALALAPLAAHHMLGADVVVNATSGVSGAGRSAKQALLFSEVNDNYKAYSVAGGHRHIAEIENSLGRLQAMGRQLRSHEAFEKVTVSFNPHLAPMTRGILATCYTRPQEARLPDGSPLTHDGLLQLYSDFYQGEALVHVQEELPQTKAVYGSDRCLISVRYDARSGHIIAFAAIDNLGKGAAGQAVQNLNLMCGFPESSGLQLQAVYP